MPPIVRVDPQWLCRDLMVVMNNGLQLVKNANIYRQLAVYPTLSGNPKMKDLWTIYAIASGRLVVMMPSEELAKRVVVSLWANCRRALEQTDPIKAKSMIPQWVLDWMSECFDKGKYFDPEEFEE